jgi:hypothetical protein
MKQYYKLTFLYKNKHLYTLWYTNDVDGLLNENNKIIFFNCEYELIDYCKKENINIIDDCTVIYNIDEINRIILNNSTNIDFEYLLGLWNIIADIARTIDVPFHGNKKETIHIYNKLFYGNNLPSIRGNGEIYIPRWNKREIKIILKILKECYKIFELTIN